MPSGIPSSAARIAQRPCGPTSIRVSRASSSTRRRLRSTASANSSAVHAYPPLTSAACSRATRSANRSGVISPSTRVLQKSNVTAFSVTVSACAVQLPASLRPAPLRCSFPLAHPLAGTPSRAPSRGHPLAGTPSRAPPAGSSPVCNSAPWGQRERAQRCGQRATPRAVRGKRTQAWQPSLPAERDVLEHQVQVFDGPADLFPGALLHLVLPVGVDPAAFDVAATPPLFVLEGRRRQRLAEHVFDALEAQRDLLLASGQPVEKRPQRVVLRHTSGLKILIGPTRLDTLHNRAPGNSDTVHVPGCRDRPGQSQARDVRPLYEWPFAEGAPTTRRRWPRATASDEVC